MNVIPPVYWEEAQACALSSEVEADEPPELPSESPSESVAGVGLVPFAPFALPP